MKSFLGNSQSLTVAWTTKQVKNKGRNYIELDVVVTTSKTEDTPAYSEHQSSRLTFIEGDDRKLGNLLQLKRYLS